MRLKKLLVGLATTTVMMLGMATMSYADDVSKAKEIKPVDITDFKDESQMMTWQYDLIDDSYLSTYNNDSKVIKYFKFTLHKPACVVIKSYMGLCWSGDTENMYLGQTNIFTDNESINKDKVHILEPGTYYIKYTAHNYHGYDANDNPQAYLSIFKQDLERTGTTSGKSTKEAIALNNGKYGVSSAYGVVTEQNDEQWFKIVLKNKSDVKITCSQDALEGDSYGHLNGALYPEVDGVVSASAIKTNWNFESIETTLAEGTYYFKVAGFCTRGRAKVTIDVDDNYAPPAPETKTYKSGSKYIKGNAEIGTTVYAKVGKKTYKANTDKYGVFKINTPVLKVGNKITVYAKDSVGNKSAVLKLTVKNRTLSSPKIKSAKKNTKLVKGTSKKGLTVQVTYGGKTFKKKLTSKNFSVKVSKKLTKGSTVKVKVVDAYGNYSKTVTYKVK